MAKVELNYNPYLMETEIKFNGQDYSIEYSFLVKANEKTDEYLAKKKVTD